MQKFKSVDEVVSELKPVNPIYCIRKNSIKTACNWFNKNFPGKVLYAVKTNPHEEVIKEIKNGEKLTQKNIWVKRPGNGDFSANNYWKILGKQAIKNINKNIQIRKSDIK